MVRTYDVLSDSPSCLIHELPLKLSRKCLDVFGAVDHAQSTVTPPSLSG